MKYTVTTPETVQSKYYEVKNVEEFITNLKERYPNITLGKADLWVLDWTPKGYSRNEYIILKEVTTEDLVIIRKILNPTYKIFKIRSSNTELVGYIDIIDNEIYLSDEYNKLQNIREYYSAYDEYNSLANICWAFRTNLKELVLKHNRINFRFDELFNWGVKDPKIDVEYEVINSNIPSTITGNPDNKMIVEFKNEVFVRCNNLIIKTDTIIENEKFVIFNDKTKIIKDMIDTLSIIGDD